MNRSLFLSPSSGFSPSFAKSLPPHGLTVAKREPSTSCVIAIVFYRTFRPPTPKSTLACIAAPAGDGRRVYVGLENGDAVQAIDTITNQVIASIPVGQLPAALVYVPNAAVIGDGQVSRCS